LGEARGGATAEDPARDDGSFGDIVIDAALPETIGEVQQLKMDHRLTTVELDGTYENPVVFAQVMTSHGWQPVAVRIHDVGADSVTLRLQEPNYLDGWHMVEDVALFVVEAGTHVLADGTRVEAGTMETGRLTSQGFEKIAFSADFEETPTILSQVQTRNGGDFVVTRQKDPNADGFSLAMQEEEALNDGGHVTETVGWIAMERGTGDWSDIAFEAGHTGTKVDHNRTTHDFAADFDAAPLMLASLCSYFGANTAMTRLTEVGRDGFTGRVQEEQSRDRETWHLEEGLDYVAFARAGQLEGVTLTPDDPGEAWTNTTFAASRALFETEGAGEDGALETLLSFSGRTGFTSATGESLVVLPDESAVSEVGLTLDTPGHAATIGHDAISALLGTDTWQIEFDVAADSGASAGELFRIDDALAVAIDGTGALVVTLEPGGAAPVELTVAGVDLADRAEHSVRLASADGAFTVTVDGTEVAREPLAAVLAPAGTPDLAFGAPAGSDDFEGVLASLEILAEDEQPPVGLDGIVPLA
jgi:hypothetical protein